MNMSQGMAIGMIAGLLVGLILVVILLKYANKDKKVKTEYDERQKEIKNKGYVCGFYTMVALLAVESILSVAEIEIPVADFIQYFAILIAGITVMGGYAIWNGVYWGLNNDKKRYAMVFAVAIVLNLLAVVLGMKRGNIFSTDPVTALPLFNVIVLIMFVVLFAVMLIRYLVDKVTEEED